MTTAPDLTGRRLAWGEGVKILRTLHKLTQAQLAEQAGTTQATISRIERGSRQIPDSTRLRIAAALNVHPYQLFPYEDEAQS